MSERDEILALLDELQRLLAASPAASIEVETDTFRVKVARAAVSDGQGEPSAVVMDAIAETEKVQRVHATTVGIFSAAREWKKGDDVKRGVILGAIQSLGHMADITAPADGRIEEVLVAGGAPVEYGQALFAIALG